MGLVHFNALLTITGKFGDMYIVKQGNKYYTKHCPEREPKPATAAQAPVREGIVQGNRYWRRIAADPAQKAVYELAGKVQGRRATDLAKADFAHPPSVLEIDVAGYFGNVGDVIRIQAKDDFEVVRVAVRILNLEKAVIEEGEATFDKAAEWWVYAAKVAVASGQGVIVQAAAYDRPGHSDLKQLDRVCGPR